MAIETVNIGSTPNDGTGDTARAAFTKINENFTAPENAASKVVATNAQALAGTVGVLPDAAGVHSAIRGLAVGTVSQSGGVPTGAIIERGSNANGEFVRYADGTQICTHKITLSPIGFLGTGVLTDMFRTNVASWTYPVIFASTPTIQTSSGGVANAAGPNAPFGVRSNLPVTASGAPAIQAFGAVETGENVPAHLTAIGRWY